MLASVGENGLTDALGFTSGGDGRIEFLIAVIVLRKLSPRFLFDSIAAEHGTA